MSDFLMHLPEELRDSLGAQLLRAASISGVRQMVLYGSYAKGTSRPDSDVDVAFFVDISHDDLLTWYRRLVPLCIFPEIDVQIQVFAEDELACRCGIIDEIIRYGVFYSDH